MQSQTQSNVLQKDRPATRTAASPRRLKRGWLIGGTVVLVLVGTVVFGILTRLSDAQTVRAETIQMAVPSVSIISPRRSASAQELVLPGNVQPFISAPIYSRTNGYLKRWHADIGDHVTQGQPLSDIKTPQAYPQFPH